MDLAVSSSMCFSTQSYSVLQKRTLFYRQQVGFFWYKEQANFVFFLKCANVLINKQKLRTVQNLLYLYFIHIHFEQFSYE